MSASFLFHVQIIASLIIIDNSSANHLFIRKDTFVFNCVKEFNVTSVSLVTYLQLSCLHVMTCC